MALFQDLEKSRTRYYVLIVGCCLVALACIFKNELFNFEKAEDILKTVEEVKKEYMIPVELGSIDKDEYKWLMEQRMDNYLTNIEVLHEILADIVAIVMIGILLVLFRPKGINISFISLTVPEGLLYIIVFCGGMYTWQRFGLELNAAIDSRLCLQYGLENYIGAPFLEELGDQHNHRHILVDNAIVDNWHAVFLQTYKENSPRYLWANAGLYGVYGILCGMLYAIIFMTIIELGYRKEKLMGLSIIILIFMFFFLALANFAWLFEHPYSNKFLAFYWMTCAVCLLFWKLIGVNFADVLSKDYKKIEKEEE